MQQSKYNIVIYIPDLLVNFIPSLFAYLHYMHSNLLTVRSWSAPQNAALILT